MSDNTWCSELSPDRLYGTQEDNLGSNYPDYRMAIVTETYKKIPSSFKYEAM